MCLCVAEWPLRTQPCPVEHLLLPAPVGAGLAAAGTCPHPQSFNQEGNVCSVSGGAHLPAFPSAWDVVIPAQGRPAALLLLRAAPLQGHMAPPLPLAWPAWPCPSLRSHLLSGKPFNQVRDELSREQLPTPPRLDLGRIPRFSPPPHPHRCAEPYLPHLQIQAFLPHFHVSSLPPFLPSQTFLPHPPRALGLPVVRGVN